MEEFWVFLPNVSTGFEALWSGDEAEGTLNSVIMS